MNENKKSGIGAWAVGLFGFLAGLFIGLVILGWWLWPVQWTGGSLEVLSPAVQEDYLRAAIDSNAYHPDDELARQRYQALGQFGPSTLAAISAEPGAQSAEDIEEFAAAVGATAVIKNPPAEAPAPFVPELAFGRVISAPMLAGLCIAVLLILLVLLILFILMRRSRNKAAQAESEAVPTFAPLEEETVSADTAPIVTAAAVAETTEEQGEELPDWLQETGPELEQAGEEPIQEEFDLLGGEAEQSLTDEDIAAIRSSRFSPADGEEEMIPDFLKGALPTAAVAGAGVVAAAALTGEEEQPEGEPEPEAFAEAEMAEEFPVEPAPGAFAEAEMAEEFPVEPEPGAFAGAEMAEEFPVVPVALGAEAVAETFELEEGAGEVEEFEESPEEVHAKFSRDIRTVEGIGPVYADKLRSIGISAPLLLLRNGATTKGRQQIAEATGISDKLILKWVNYVDLFRIKGVGQEYAELLEAAGVDTVPELAMRNPKNLHEKMLEVAEQKKIVRRPPALSMVESWVEQAKKLPRAIFY